MAYLFEQTLVEMDFNVVALASKSSKRAGFVALVQSLDGVGTSFELCH
jgi:hypothetical protein